MMAATVDLLESWVRRVATGLGALAIILPLARVWLARHTERGGSSGSPTALTRWPAVFLLAVAYVTVGVLLWKPIADRISPGLQLTLILVGAILYFPGLVLYGWGFKTLGTMFGVSSGFATQLYQGHRLVEEGPYAYLRHPMYLSVLMVAVGALLIFRTWAMAIYAPTAFGIIVRARREEQLLAREFGEAWDRYATRVPAWFPRLGRREKDGA